MYPGKPSAGGATERTQDALTPDAAARWRDQVVAAAAAGLAAGGLWVRFKSRRWASDQRFVPVLLGAAPSR